MADCFLDTNILLYAVSTEPAEANKTRVARGLVQTEDWTWSAQVAAEFIHAGTRPRQPKPLTRAEALRWVETWMAFPMAAVDGALVIEAARVAERFQPRSMTVRSLPPRSGWAARRFIPKTSMTDRITTGCGW